MRSYSFQGADLTSEEHTLASKVMRHRWGGTVERATLSEDKLGCDYWLTVDGIRLAIDVKLRRSRYLGDLALETWSCMENSVPGWTLDPHKITDFVVWIYTDPLHSLAMHYPALRQAFSENLDDWCQRFQIDEQRTPRSHTSQCVFVPTDVIFSAMGGIVMPDGLVAHGR